MTPELYRRCQRALQVSFPDGSVLGGGRACVYILRVLGYHRTATVMALWPFYWFVEVGYSVVARHRLFFSRFVFRRE